jgi:hypothetical protein
MTAEEGLKIFWKTYAEYSNRFDGRKPLNQTEAYEVSMQAVLDANTKEIDGDWAKRYLAWSEFKNA